MKNKKIITSLSVLFLTVRLMTPQAAFGQEAAKNQEKRNAVGSYGFVQCEGLLNLRETPDKKGKVVGLMENNSIVFIQDMDEFGWYQVVSGPLTGYVAAEYIATGEKANKLYQTAGHKVAEIGADIINVRAEPNQNSKAVDAAKAGEKLDVTQDLGDWAKVITKDGIEGFVSGEYSYIHTEYKTAYPVKDEETENEIHSEDSVEDEFVDTQSSISEESEVSEETSEITALETEISEIYAGEESQEESETYEVDANAWQEQEDENTEYVQEDSGVYEDTYETTEGLSEEDHYEEDIYDTQYTEETWEAEENTSEEPQTEQWTQTEEMTEAPVQTDWQEESIQQEGQESNSDILESETEVSYQTEDISLETEETQPDSASPDDASLLAALIYHEAGNQPYEGQVAVGAVVMNRVASSSFPGTIQDVIFQSGQFVPASSGDLDNIAANGIPSSCVSAAAEAMAGSDPTGGALYFNTGSGKGNKIGDHQFY